MQSVSSRIWTRVAVSISYNDNHYTTGSDVLIADAGAPVVDGKFHIHFSNVNLFEFLAVSEQTRDRLVSAIKEDKNPQKLIKLIKQSFPIRYKALELQLKHLYKFRDNLSTKDNVVFYKDSLWNYFNENWHERKDTQAIRLVESVVKQIKYIIIKYNNESSDPCLAILEFTNTPSKSTGMSPVQKFFGIQLRSVLPMMKKCLSPFNVEETKTKIGKARQQSKKHYEKKHPWPDRIKNGWPGDCATIWQEPILEKENCHRKVWIPAIHDRTGKWKKTNEK